ncbi:membrane protein insertase YidC [Massilia sp. CF038]|uniref:membrane protein insertase YidC n=1 Tax=Massilia sp. CF038 TaxID=1881045 RepID=UPI000917699E|nr:membrane protein insertase YidC [Massilia sp. CF038]SHH67981.1 protein translocase subunit yidC [Massilia sp. CF038]
MDINKRTILWIVFSISLAFLWDSWMVSQGNPSFFSMTPPPAKVAPATPAGAAAQTNSGVPSGITGAAIPAVPGAAAPIKTEVVTITTDVVKVDIDTNGGVIKRLELLKFRDKIDQKKNQVLMNVSDKGTYLAQTGLVNTVAGPVPPNHTTPFVAVPGPRMLNDANEVKLVLEAVQDGIKLTKTFTFKRGNYVIDMLHQVTNNGSAPISPLLYLQLQHDGNPPEGDSFFTSSYTGPTMYTSINKYEKLQFKDIEKKKADHVKKANDGWIAISQHYFVSAFLPPQNMPRDIETRTDAANLYAIATKLPLGQIAPGATVSTDVRLYSGPQDENRLEQIAPGLELVKDYGWLVMIAKPIFWVMDKMHSYIGNWGWTIIAFTIAIKLLFFPLSAAGYKSMARIKVVTPKMQAIREKYKGDPAKMNQATMELYKTEKINPLGGCLPILVQMPVFIALYYVLSASAEMRGAPWISWITDLTQPDPLFILPVLYAISMFITTKLNPAPADPIQAKMMLFMPLAFSVMFIFFPSGLVLYWVVNNILSIAQQWVITKKFEDAAAKKK